MIGTRTIVAWIPVKVQLWTLMKIRLHHLMSGPDESMIGAFYNRSRWNTIRVCVRFKKGWSILCQVKMKTWLWHLSGPGERKVIKATSYHYCLPKEKPEICWHFCLLEKCCLVGWVLATWFCSFWESRILPKITNLSQTCKTLPLTWIIHMRRLARVCSHRAVVSDVDKIDMAVTTSMKWWL